MKKSVLIGIALLVLFGLVGSSVWYFEIRNDKPEEKTSVQPKTDAKEYSTVEVSSLDKSEEYGSVWVKEGQIVNDISIQEINNYIEKKKTSWETGVHEYPTGGMTEDGSLWDGTAETSINQPDFIRFVFVELVEEFGEEYEINLIEI